MATDVESSSPSWGWPLARSSAADSRRKESPSDAERAFDIADLVEKGIVREIATDFIRPLKRSSKLWRFTVSRSVDKLQYWLFSDDGDFLMYARVSLEADRVEFFLYNPNEAGETLYDPSRPAFTMKYSKDRMDWRITQERCEHCQFLPKQSSCASHGKQQVAFIRQCKSPIGDGIFNEMDVNIPGLYSDGSRVLWCPRLGKRDLASPSSGSHEVQRLVTKKPSWHEDVGSLVLDFKGRQILSSAKNFQLALRQKPEHVICQFGKVGPNTFGLDLRYPLSIIQAFGASLTTLFWT